VSVVCAVIVTAAIWKTGQLKHNWYMISHGVQMRHFQHGASWTILLQSQ